MDQKYTRIAFLVFFAALTVLFAVVTWPFYKAAFLAFVLVIIFVPLYRFFLEKLKFHRYLAATIVTILIGVCVILPIAVLCGVLATQVGKFLHEFSQQLEAGSFSTTLGAIVDTLRDWIERLTGSAPSHEDIVAAMLNSLKTAGKKFYEFSPRVLSTTISIVVNYILMLLFVVVFFAEGKTLYDWFKEISPLSYVHWKELAHEVRVTITTSIVAIFVIALAQGLLLGLAFFLAGFSQFYGWCLIAIILSLIPVVGAPSCYIVASAILFFSGSTKGAIIFLIYGFGVISTVDNLIRSLIVRGTARIHPLLIFVALIGAVRLLGPIGLLVGPVLLSIFLASLRIYRREFARNKA